MSDISTITLDPKTSSDCFKSFKEQNDDIVTLFTNIQTNYIDECEKIWNAPKAYRFISDNLGSYNDFIEQYNRFFPDAYDAFIQLTNAVLTEHEIGALEPEELTSIAVLTCAWDEKKLDDRVQVTFEFSQFTIKYLETPVEAIRDCLKTMSNLMNTVQDGALAGYFGDTINQGIQNLITSADGVVTEYTEASKTAAATEDENMATLAGK